MRFTKDRPVIATAAFVVGVAVGMPLGMVLSSPAVASAEPAPVCQEDDPCWDAERDGNGVVGPDWDCATMGDLICPIDSIPQPGDNPFDCRQNWWGSWQCVLVDSVVLR